MWPKIVKFSVVNVKEITKHKDTKPSETCKDKLYMPLNKGLSERWKESEERERERERDHIFDDTQVSISEIS